MHWGLTPKSGFLFMDYRLIFPDVIEIAEYANGTPGPHMRCFQLLVAGWKPLRGRLWFMEKRMF
jgi:hypothetical protein